MRIATRLRDFAFSFAASRRGTAAIEFAFIVPVLAAIVITVADVANIATGRGEMQTAIRASLQYAMNGGTDMTVAQTQGNNSWDGKPSDGTLTATRACYCGNDTHSCTSICGDNTYPTMYVTVTASGTMGGSVIRHLERITGKVRIE